MAREERPQPSSTLSHVEYLRAVAEWVGIQWTSHSTFQIAEAAILAAANLKEENERLRNQK